MITVKQIIDNKKQFIDLLLIGDEQENMIDLYLEQSDVFALYDDDKLKAIGAIKPLNESICELKNIAVYKQHQGQGYGKYLIQFFLNHYKNCYKTMVLGTGKTPSTLSFYKSLGFKFSHVIKDFFIENYDHPIFEEGTQLIDMIYLQKNLN